MRALSGKRVADPDGKTARVSAPNPSRRDEALRIPELASRARLRRNLTIAVVVVVAIAIFAFYQRPKPQTELFRTVEVSRRTVIQSIDAAGRLDVRKRTEVPAPLAGRLLAIRVHEGDYVEQGQSLATLDERAAEVTVRQAQAASQAAAGGSAEAAAALEAAERTLKRAQSLAERGFGSAEDVARAESDRDRARAAANSARAEQRVAGEQIAAARLAQSLGLISAPASGVVLRAPENVGAAVGPEQGPLFVIGDPLDTLRVDASVSETDVPFVKAGMPAKVTIIALPGETFDAKVEHVGIEPKLEGGAVLYRVRLAVENRNNTLLPGMSARVRIEIARADNVLSVHEAALRFVPEDAEPKPPRSRVWKRVGPAEVEEVTVRAGISDGVHAVLLSAPKELAIGDQIAVGYMRADSKDRGPAVKLGGKK